MIERKSFRYKSYKREIILNFSNDSIVNLTNIFYCKDLKNEYKVINIQGIYKRLNKEMILVRNIECKDNNCLLPPTIEIPPQESVNCDFLNIEKRRDKVIFDGRSYSSDFKKYGLIPNLDVDTLFTIKNKIYLIKKIINEGMTLGFEFK
jgi:hypothetical protein